MPSIAAHQRYTEEQYLAQERQASSRSEYLDGYAVAMAGASRRHNLIAGNLYREVSQQLRGRACEAYISDMRVKVSRTGLYAYPDVVVVCGKLDFEDAHKDTLLNPTLLVEVLSNSTEAYDRGEKFAHYRQLETLQEVLLVSQNKARIEHYVRQGAQWVLSEISALDTTVHLSSIDCVISLQDVYDKVEIAQAEEPK